jgi:hypothetical protein
MKLLDNFSHYLIAVGGVTLTILSIPLIAMQFTDEVAWSFLDFVIAGIFLSGSGITFGLIARRLADSSYRYGVGLGVLASLALMWVNGAVGIIGSENNDINVLYALVIAAVFFGGIVSRLNPRGLAITMFLAAGIQFIIPIIGLFVWKWTGMSHQEFWGAGSILRTFVFNSMFMMMYLVAGLLFNLSEKEGKAPSMA